MEADHRRQTGRAQRHSGIAAVGLLVLAMVAMACHVAEIGHLESIHTEPYASIEQYCVEDSSENPPDVAEANTWIQEALRNNGHSQDWEALATIDQGSYGDCANVDTFEELVELDIHYHLVDDGEGACAGSCAIPGAVSSVHHGHDNFDTYEIYLAAGDITGSDPAGINLRRHAINHETGHAYGLADPTQEFVPKSYEDCWMVLDNNGDGRADLTRVLSIMHNSGWCADDFPDFPWPTNCDLRIVDLIATEHPYALTEELGDFKGTLCGE